MITYETNYLAHHGIRGMKWGHRKQRVLKGRRRGSGYQKIGRGMGKVSNAVVRTKATRLGRRAGAMAGMTVGVGAVGITASILKKTGHLNMTSAVALAAVPIGTTIVGSILGNNKAYDAVKKRQPKY